MTDESPATKTAWTKEELPERGDLPHYEHATGGWGSVKGMGKVLLREKPSPAAFRTLLRQNKTASKGHMCTSCAWGKPAEPHAFEFCENGAKATMWELTTDRCTPDFFARHTVSQLKTWDDHDLEMQGRLTQPLRYDPASDKYVAVGWDEAFAAIGAKLRTLDPKAATFYASGRAGLEASYLYALFARMYGHNNLPDSSNMCHETTSVGLKKVIGSPVGTCIMEDFEHCDAIFYCGQNPGTNSPRFLHMLKAAVERGCKLVVLNPLIEKGLVEFVDPQNPMQMTVGKSTKLADLYLQVKPGGDIAALMGIIKHALEIDRERKGTGQRPVLDRAFIKEHCNGFNAMADQVDATDWAEIERHSGLKRADMEAAARIYADAEAVIGVYGMGLTQHVHGSQAIGMLVNLLLMGGHMGRRGAGMSPVRGHSNVQGQRTVGMSEKPELVPNDRLRELFDFEPPMEQGVNVVEMSERILAGDMKAVVQLGGNLTRALPDHRRTEPSWADLDLTVSIATKLNRSHLICGKQSYILPCLARSEIHMEQSGPQSVSMEDSFSHVSGSLGKATPASAHLLSEVAIICELAKATLPAHARWKWDEWRGDYSKIRDLISETYAQEFYDMNARMWQPGGFYRGNPVREHIWKTDSGKAEFTAPTTLTSLGIGDAPGRYHMITLRSNDQFNTTIYGFDDRLRGLKGSRHILLMNPREITGAGLHDGQRVDVVADYGDNIDRRVSGVTITAYNLPDGCVAGYYPEMNPLVALSYHDKLSQTPASKGIPVRIEAGAPVPA